MQDIGWEVDGNVEEDVRLEWLPVRFRIVPELPYLAGGGGGGGSTRAYS